MAVKHRCNFCRKPLREDNTCSNPECPRYVPEESDKEDKKESNTSE